MKSRHIVTAAIMIAAIVGGCSFREGATAPVVIAEPDTLTNFRSNSEVNADSSLGPVLIRTYSGRLPLLSDVPSECRLVVKHREHSGDGVFILSVIDNDNGKTYRYEGKRYTLRGTADNDNATVWQFKSDSGRLFNFLYNSSNDTLILLNDNFEEPAAASGVTLHHSSDIHR